MPPNRFESEVESFLEGSHGDRTHIKRADHHTVTPLCGTLLAVNTQVIRFACELEARPGSLYARARLLGQPARGGSGGRALRSGPRRCRRRECATDCAPNPTERTRSHMRRPTVQLNRGNELRPGVFCMPEAAHLSAATSLPVNGRPVFTRALHQVNFLAT